MRTTQMVSMSLNALGNFGKGRQSQSSASCTSFFGGRGDKLWREEEAEAVGERAREATPPADLAG